VVADDHPLVLEAAASILSGSFDVAAAVTSGEAALEAARRLDPHVIVLDIAMPGLNGFQTAARLREEGIAARIVFLSNHTGDDFVLAAMSIGASAFVQKPRMQRDLVAAVDHACAGRAFVPAAAVLPHWRRSAARRHDLQFYEDDAQLVDAIAALFRSALKEGDSVIAVTTEARGRELNGRLRDSGIDACALAATGRYQRVDMNAAIASVVMDGAFDADRFTMLLDPIVSSAAVAATGQPPHVTVFGEMASALCSAGRLTAALDLERAVSAFAATRPMSVLCAYCTERLPAGARDLLTRICAEHSTIVAPASS
jgi:CheY-like chemotaxis protein